MRGLKLGAMVALAAFAITVPNSAGAQGTKDGQRPPAEAPPKAPAAVGTTPVYKPPLLGAPGGRIGGGTRGTAREIFVLSVLAPDHNALTVAEQPSLYWFISKPTSLPMELTVMDPGTARPLLETRLAAEAPGVHRVRLADHGVRLAPGVPYRWYVAIVPDPGRRSRDILAGASIERVELPAALQARVAQAQREDVPSVYAEAGFWYDAVEAISELIESRPTDADLRRQRAGLLSQAGLPNVEPAEGGSPR